LKKPPENHVICPSCGTEFGYSDVGPESIFEIHSGLRSYWVDHGAKWHSRAVAPPQHWNGYRQLIEAGLTGDVPFFKNLTITIITALASTATGRKMVYR
jgi:hypothetical protein